MKHTVDNRNLSTAYYALKMTSIMSLVMLLAGPGCVMETGATEGIEEAATADVYLQEHEPSNPEMMSWDEYLEGMPMDEFLERMTMSVSSNALESPTAEDGDVDISCVPSPFTDYDCTDSVCGGEGRLRYRTCEECNGVVISCGSWTYTQSCC